MNKYNPEKNRNSYFSSVTKDELENLLKLDFLSSDEDCLSAENIQTILESILQHEQNTDIPSKFNAEDGWAFFKENYLLFAEKGLTLYDSPLNFHLPQKHDKRIFLHRKNVILTMLVFCIAVASFSTTTRAKELFDHIANWSAESFWFSLANKATDSTSIDLSDEFDDTFFPIDIPENILPTWFPENFVKKTEDIYELHTKELEKVVYENVSSSEYFSISIAYLHSETTTIYEKDVSDVIIYQADGIDFYIINNMDTLSAIWKYGSFECQITGNISKEILLGIIDSIPAAK